MIRRRKIRLAALAAVVAILVIIYFAVINSGTDTTNPHLTRGEQRLQQAVKSSGRPVPARVRRLTACILAAGADVGRIHACQAKYRR